LEVLGVQSWGLVELAPRLKRQSRVRVTLDTRESCEMQEMVKTRSRRFGTSVNRPNSTTSTQAKGKLR
jgi:hypothetical protein